MKNILNLLLFFISTYMFSQIAIGKSSISSPSVSLEFGEGKRGLLLPWVNSSNALNTPVAGTLIYDVSDKAIKYRKDGVWANLSRENQGEVNTILQDHLKEEGSAKAIIGEDTEGSLAEGILVLADKNKAMVLPKVDQPHLSIVDPAAGMVVYDTYHKHLAVFNGKEWSFWKP